MLYIFALRIISAASLVEKERSRRLGTSILNQVVKEAVSFKAPPRTRGGKRGRVYYTTQVTYGLILSSCNLLIKLVFIR
jgi:GTP-binding protein